MKAFTLIEVIMAVMLLAIVLLGGTALFYQNLKLTGLSDVSSNLDNTLQSILGGLEKDIRFGEVTGVGVGTRTDCLLAGDVGYVGNSLYTSDLGGHETVYTVMNNKIASTSSETNRITYLNTDQITIESLQFTWYCLAGISDKIKVAIDASSSALGTGTKVEQSVSLEINLLNSGLN